MILWKNTLISETEAITQGIGRNSGETMRIVNLDNEKGLYFMGFKMKKNPDLHLEGRQYRAGSGGEAQGRCGPRCSGYRQQRYNGPSRKSLYLKSSRHSTSTTPGGRWTVGFTTSTPSSINTYKDYANWGLLALFAIDKRHKYSFRYFMTGFPFEYEIIRKFYQVYREFLIEN